MVAQWPTSPNPPARLKIIVEPMKPNRFVDWGWGLTALLGGAAILAVSFMTPATGGLGRRIVPIVIGIGMFIQGVFLLRRAYRRRGALNKTGLGRATEGSNEQDQ